MIRQIWFSSHPDFTTTPDKIPINLQHFSVPKFLTGIISVVRPNHVLSGKSSLHSPNLSDVSNPLIIGTITLDNSPVQVGHNIKRLSQKGTLELITDSGYLRMIGDNSEILTIGVFDVLKTNFQVYSIPGVSFAVGSQTQPAGHGHTLIWGPINNVARSLSLLECWTLTGGLPFKFPHLQLTNVEYDFVFSHNNPFEFTAHHFSFLLGTLTLWCETQPKEFRTSGDNTFRFPSKIPISVRLEAISKHLSFFLRHAATKPRYEREMFPNESGYISLAHFHDICPRIRALGVTKEDIMDVCTLVGNLINSAST